MTKKPARATMEDVARVAGVSMATVSHVINKTRFVSPETIEQVRAAIQQLQYIPNSVARALATNSTSTVGLVVSWNANPYFSDIISAIETECNIAGISVLLSDPNNDPEKELLIVQSLHERRVDGIFLASTPDRMRRSIEYLMANKANTVLIDRRTSVDLDHVGIRNTHGIELLLDHVISHGYRKIAFIPGHSGYETTIERTQSFVARMAHHGLAESTVVALPSNSTDEASIQVASALSVHPDIEALVTGNNLATIGAMRALRNSGRLVPRDIALVGVDDFEWADSFEPRLTVIAQPCRSIAQNAVKLMLERLHNPTAPSRSIELEPTLIIRNSCGCIK